ncbi:hypothetical protein [Photobacterium leiognathi]|uniref:hypothetical protein n=1 Tax=Photobacterium leiognathi TaxID=553611 RepID=UPI0027392A74|nr:hypothetical protein [Photobacterium leiognathi]
MDKKHHAKQTGEIAPQEKRKIAMVYSNWVVYPVRTHHKNKKGGREYIAVPLLPNWRTP